MGTATLGVIIGNRDFFPDHLATEGRKSILDRFQGLGIEPVMLSEGEGKLGAVETYEDAKDCASLLRTNEGRIDGVLVSLPNFGDEKGVTDALRLSRLDVPVLVQAFPDDLQRLQPSNRRDAFCGKISVCNNLRQAGIPFSLTKKHVVHPADESFTEDLRRFAAICRVVKGLRRARLGVVGARPAAFNTVRHSEKLLERSGISVTTIDLSEIVASTQGLADTDPGVRAKAEDIRRYAAADEVPAEAITVMAKLALVLSEWIAANELNGTAVQCWTSIQQNLGINPCTVMSMMSEMLLPSACEVDVTGLVAMYALQLASESPSAMVDWNNNYGDREDRCVLFHCGNWAKSFLADPVIGTAPILGTVLGEDRTYGALNAPALPSSVTYARVSTDDCAGLIRAYVGEGRIVDEPLATFGNRAVIEVSNLEQLMRYVCQNGFEHHVAINRSNTADVIAEAFAVYLGWGIYHHQGPIRRGIDRDRSGPCND